MSRIAIIGAGSWGTALSITLGSLPRHQITLWAHEREVAESLERDRENRRFLPGYRIPATVRPTHSLEQALRDAEIVLTVMPSHHVRSVAAGMRPHLAENAAVVSATKGIEDRSFLRMSEVLAETLDTQRIGALSGPSFAEEVAKGDPTAITFASADAELAACVQREFSGPAFRIYLSDDIIGVELGGALKNIIALAAGMVEGLALGHNSAAALITRGLAEITRLAVACGARRETLSGLSGMGDLVLTCTGGLSRNRRVGVALGHGQKLSDIIAGMHGMVAEGVLNTEAALGLARRKGVEMPIAEQMHLILQQGKAPAAALQDLMSRPGRAETD